MPEVTLMPMPYFTGLDLNGRPVANGKVRFFQAGSPGVLQTVYQDPLGEVPHDDPISLDGAGNATIFFDSTKSYKMELYDSAMVFIRERDFLSAVPSLNADLDYIGTAGEDIPALTPVYLENGTGGGQVGKWYRTDSAVAAKSYGALLVGIAPAAVEENASGKFRGIGGVDGFIGLTPGATYYIGPLGTLTTAAPANAREIGLAESATRMLLPPPRPSLGQHEIFIPIGAFVPRNVASAGAGWHEDILNAGEHAYRGMPFDPVTAEYADLWYALPKSWGRSAITAQFYWTNKVGGAGSVVWSIWLDTRGDGEVFDGIHDGTEAVADAALPANTLAISAETAPMTPANSPQINDMLFIRVGRNVADASDTYASDAYLLGVKLRIQITAGNDA